jgi:hypothetical protein
VLHDHAHQDEDKRDHE